MRNHSANHMSNIYGYNHNSSPSSKIYYLNNNAVNKKVPLDPQKLNFMINNQSINEEDSDPLKKLNNSTESNKSASRLEKEMQWKVKTILKRDILGRYRKSPYLKSFEQL